MRKIVRDKIPDLYPQHDYEKARFEDRLELMIAKVREELGEFEEAVSEGGRRNVVEELADLGEALSALIARAALQHGFTPQELRDVADRKREARGGFGECWVLTHLN